MDSKPATHLAGRAPQRDELNSEHLHRAGAIRELNMKPRGLVLTLLAAAVVLCGQPATAQEYPVVDTGQITCFDTEVEIACPASGEAFYGQDAQHPGNAPAFTDNGDGTVTDEVTGLMWQQSPDTDGDGDIDAADKLTRAEAVVLPGHPQCPGLRRPHRLAAADHQGALFAHRFQRDRPQRLHGHRHRGAHPLHRHGLLRFRLWRHRRR